MSSNVHNNTDKLSKLFNKNKETNTNTKTPSQNNNFKNNTQNSSKDINLINLKVIHWNPNSIFNKKAELDEFIINEINPDIISLNETKLSEFRAQRFFTNNNYHLINKSRDENKNGAGGVAILIKKTFKYVEIKESFLNEIEALAIEIY